MCTERGVILRRVEDICAPSTSFPLFILTRPEFEMSFYTCLCNLRTENIILQCMFHMRAPTNAILHRVYDSRVFLPEFRMLFRIFKF